MSTFGARVVEFGKDFDEAKHEAHRVAAAENLHFVPSFHWDLVAGVASYALELFRAVAKLDAVYVGVGMGSGICGLITVRDLLGLKTRDHRRGSRERAGNRPVLRGRQTRDNADRANICRWHCYTRTAG